MLRQDEKTIVLGISGSGKSTLTKAIANSFPRLLIVDTMSEYETDPDDFIATNPAELGELAKLTITHKPKFIRILYRPNFSLDPRDELETIARTLYEVRNFHLLIEEFPEYSNASFMPLSLKRLVLTGRKLGLGVTATSQRPAETPKTFISQCSHVYCARFDEPNDVKYLEKMFGSNFINSMRKLKKYEFLHYERGGKIALVRA